jgi:hypothetical protein
MQPSEILERGREILEPTVQPYGFAFVAPSQGKGSGGEFASGEFVRGDRRLELHFRYSLGLVTYHVGATSVAHELLMRVLLGSAGGNAYPGYSTDPLDGFRHLQHDLLRYGAAFLNGTDAEFTELAHRAASLAKLKGFRALPNP